MSFLNNLFKPKSALPKYSQNVRSYLDSYNDKPVYTIVDMGLAEIAPVEGFDRYISVILPVQVNPEGQGAPVGDSELKFLHKLESKCIREAEAKGFLYAGRNIVMASENMYIVFYCKDADKDATKECLKQVCQASGRDPTRIFSKPDKEWELYLEKLYPDIYHMQPMNHQEIIDDVKKHGDSGEKPRSVSFYLYFNTKEEAEHCLGEAASNGYTLEAINDMRQEKDFNGKLPFSLGIKKDLPLNIDTLNTAAWALIDMARKYGGEYDGIETEVIKGG